MQLPAKKIKISNFFLKSKLSTLDFFSLTFNSYQLKHILLQQIRLCVQVRLLLHWLCQFAGFFSAILRLSQSQQELAPPGDNTVFILIYSTFPSFDVLHKILLWKENWWTCFLSIQCFPFFIQTQERRDQNQGQFYLFQPIFHWRLVVEYAKKV